MNKPASAARLAGVGVFVVGGLLLFTVGLFMIGDRQMAFAKKLTIYTEFAKITGLQPGSVVRVSGAKAGSVKQIVPPGKPSDKFRVKLEIAQDLHQLVRMDSVASIETEGLVGGSYLGISTGSDGAAPVAVEGTIGSREPFELTDLMQQINGTVKKVNDTLDETRDDLEHAIVSVTATVDNANTLITDVSGDVKQLAKSGRKLSEDAVAIIAGVRAGNGSLGKFVNDDEFYKRANTIAAQVQEIAGNAKDVVESAKKTLEGFQSKDGPVQGMTADVKQTMDDARQAMAGFAENMDALKHNFLLRGFFKGRGYFDLAQISPAEYRRGALTKGSDRRLVRVWERSDRLFEPALESGAGERLTAAGKAWVDSAIAPYLEHVAAGIVVVEGYAQHGTPDAQYLRSRARASLIREYLIARFHLDPQATGAMPLSGDSAGSPDHSPWDGAAVAVILPKTAFEASKRSAS